MSKERLEEITSSVGISLSSDGHVLLRRKHYEWLIEQAKRAQELERKYEERENELIRILTNRYKYTTQLENTEIILSGKIKHYREVFEKLYKFDGNVEEHSALAYMLCGELLHVETLESEK